MVDKNDALIREVDEELRREQLAKMWDRYGTYALAAAALFVAAVAGYKVWESRQLARAEAGGAQYNEAQRLTEAGKPEEAAKALEALGKSGHRGYSTLADLQQAGALLKSGKRQEALAIFEGIASNANVDSMFRDLARLQAASLRLGEADFTEMQNRLNPLVAGESPWRHNARELLGLAAMKAGRTDDATQTFQSLLADRATPKGVLERARVMMGALTTAALATPAGTPAPPAPTASEASGTASPATTAPK
jgi:hypothetical protein